MKTEEKSKYKIYIDSSDRNSTKITLLKIEVDGEGGEVEIFSKEGKIDIVSSIEEMLQKYNLTTGDIEIVKYNQGPGSFTGLRIGATVSNVLNWVLGKKETKDLDYPKYGAEPNITPPKKFKI
jgi:tRNA A37 threonylcarbamoyladenosine modification protein TsaB